MCLCFSHVMCLLDLMHIYNRPRLDNIFNTEAPVAPFNDQTFSRKPQLYMKLCGTPHGQKRALGFYWFHIKLFNNGSLFENLLGRPVNWT